MLHSSPSSTPLSPAAIDRAILTPRSDDAPAATVDLLMSVLERAELAVVVADATGRALYMNASARSFLDSPLAVMPGWLAEALAPLRPRSSATARPSSGSSTAS
jgi:hypothetical protein